jgi:hypothetical protein
MRYGFTCSLAAVGLSTLLAACGGTPQSITSPSAMASPEGALAASGSGSDDSGVNSGGGGALRVRCEVRGTSRSKISVDGRNLAAGNYRSRVQSGGNTAVSGLHPTIGDEVEFDFDSEPDDIAAGATAIAPNFIRNGRVSGEILNSAGAVVRSATVACRVR